MVTSLINFPDRQKLSALREMSREKVKGMEFYKNLLLGWLWREGLLEEVERRKCSQQKGVATLAMSGVCGGVVYGQEMSQKRGTHYGSPEVFHQIAQSHHGYHDPREFMDSCVGHLESLDFKRSCVIM